MRSGSVFLLVIPAKAGIHLLVQIKMDPGFRRDDEG
jgi:hypothetical protein